MPHPQTAKVRGIRESTKATIVKNLVNTKNKIISLPAGQSAQPLFDVREGLLDELVRASEKSITDLNDRPDIRDFIDNLERSARDARKEANALADTSKRIQDFTAMLGRIEGIVGRIVDIAV